MSNPANSEDYEREAFQHDNVGDFAAADTARRCARKLRSKEDRNASHKKSLNNLWLTFLALVVLPALYLLAGALRNWWAGH